MTYDSLTVVVMPHTIVARIWSIARLTNFYWGPLLNYTCPKYRLCIFVNSVCSTAKPHTPPSSGLYCGYRPPIPGVRHSRGRALGLGLGLGLGGPRKWRTPGMGALAPGNGGPESYCVLRTGG